MGKDKKGGGSKGKGGKAGEFTDRLDPAEIRFTHSKIRPMFSDGRMVKDTLAEIIEGKLKPDSLRNICVIQQDGYYVSMNNRRLWVLKEARALGLLGSDNTVQVRVQMPQETRRLKDRFTLDKCSMTATFMRERPMKDQNDPEGATADSDTEEADMEVTHKDSLASAPTTS